jgi:hypothetical protein
MDKDSSRQWWKLMHYFYRGNSFHGWVKIESGRCMSGSENINIQNIAFMVWSQLYSLLLWGIDWQDHVFVTEVKIKYWVRRQVSLSYASEWIAILLNSIFLEESGVFIMGYPGSKILTIIVNNEFKLYKQLHTGKYILKDTGQFV